jgi:hypothetical protein
MVSQQNAVNFDGIPLSMKPLFFVTLLVTMLSACTEQRQRPDDALETAREFIRSSLDGDYGWARELMFEDSVNVYELNQIERQYKATMSEDDKKGYKNASIIIHSVENVNDSVTIINYSNSYKNKQMPLKIIRKDGSWQVDLNYTFSGNL